MGVGVGGERGGLERRGGVGGGGLDARVGGGQGDGVEAEDERGGERGVLALAARLLADVAGERLGHGERGEGVGRGFGVVRVGAGAGEREGARGRARGGRVVVVRERAGGGREVEDGALPTLAVAPRGERGGLLGRDGGLTLDELGCRAEDSTELAGGTDETGPLAGVEGVEGGRGRVEVDVRGVHFDRLRGEELGDVGKDETKGSGGGRDE